MLAVPTIDGSACELALFRERTETEPRLHRSGKLPTAGQYDALACHRRAHRIQPQPDRRHRAQVGGNIEIDFKSGIDLA